MRRVNSVLLGLPMTDSCFDLDGISELVRAILFRNAVNEKQMQGALAANFTANGIDYQCEVPVEGGVIELVVTLGDGTKAGILCKTGGVLSELAQQVSGYCAEPTLSAILVATTRLSHRDLPETMGGKPCRSLWCGNSVL